MTRMTAAELRAALNPKGQKRAAGKNAKRSGGFDSRAERRHYGKLKLLEKAGAIADLECQVAIPLEGRNGPILTPTGRQMVYKADFVYWDVKAGRRMIVDVKGYAADVYTIKKAILAAQGIEITEVQ